MLKYCMTRTTSRTSQQNKYPQHPGNPLTQWFSATGRQSGVDRCPHEFWEMLEEISSVVTVSHVFVQANISTEFTCVKNSVDDSSWQGNICWDRRVEAPKSFFMSYVKSLTLYTGVWCMLHTQPMTYLISSPWRYLENSTNLEKFLRPSVRVWVVAYTVGLFLWDFWNIYLSGTPVSLKVFFLVGVSAMHVKCKS
jgi:hypothetical protein